MNYLVHSRPQIEVIYDWMASGLIHHKRSCEFCNQAMALKFSLFEPLYNYYWVCSLCCREKPLTSGSPFAGINIRIMDKAIILFVERASASVAS